VERALDFLQDVDFQGGLVPADDSIGNRELLLPEASCPAGQLFQGIDGSGRAQCTTELRLQSAAEPWLTLSNTADANAPSRLDLQDRGSAGALVQGSSGAELSLWADGRKLVDLGRAGSPVRVLGDVHVQGGLTWSGDDDTFDFQCEDVVASTYLSSNSTKSPQVTCTPGYQIYDGHHSWLSAPYDADCSEASALVPQAQSVAQHAGCRFVGKDQYHCQARTDAGGYGCLRLRARCCRLVRTR
jgi:hypothetical protein